MKSNPEPIVKITFSSKLIFSSGNSISGKIGEKNLTKSRRRTKISNNYFVDRYSINIQPLMMYSVYRDFAN